MLVMITRVCVSAHGEGVHVEAVTEDNATYAANMEAGPGLAFAAQLASFVDVRLEVDPLVAAVAKFLPELPE